LHIRAVIDKYNGVTLNDCEQVTRLFNERLDILEVIDSDAYTLEISSPGLYRVFKRKEEYEAFRSRQVKVFLKEPLEQGPEAHRGRRELGGILMGLENDTVMLKTSEDTVEIPYRLVSKTKLDG
jgi:ribosome maturation factor RimP